jgi:hypothetical protein
MRQRVVDLGLITLADPENRWRLILDRLAAGIPDSSVNLGVQTVSNHSTDHTVGEKLRRLD